MPNKPDPLNIPIQQPATEAKPKIAISQSRLQSGKITQQEYDDIINRNHAQPNRFEDQAPGNGD